MSSMEGWKLILVLVPVASQLALSSDHLKRTTAASKSSFMKSPMKFGRINESMFA
jgi:hypothetical protein